MAGLFGNDSNYVGLIHDSTLEMVWTTLKTFGAERSEHGQISCLLVGER